MKTRVLILTGILLGVGGPAFALPFDACQSAVVSGADGPARLEGLLEWSVLHGVMTADELRSWLSDLQSGKTPSVESVREALVVRSFAQLLAKGDLGHEDVAKALEQFLVRINGEGDQRRVAEVETTNPFRRGKFLKFMGRNRETFEVMDTTLTFWMWGVLRGVPLVSAESGDRPLLGFHLEEIGRLIDDLNSGHFGVDKVREVFPDHQEGDVYGMMSVNQYQWLVDTWHAENLPHDQSLWEMKGVRQYAWVDNTLPGPMPVARLRPFLIQGQQMFDLIGNVEEAVIFENYQDTGNTKVHMFGGSIFSWGVKEVFKLNFATNAAFNRVQYRARNDQLPILGLRLMRRLRDP